MPTQLFAGDVIVDRIWCTSGEQASVNSFYYQILSVTGTVTDLDQCIDFDTAVTSHVNALLATTDTVNGTQSQIIDPVTAGPLAASVFTVASSGPGTVAGACLPRQTAAIASWKTQFAGRSFRGRTYFPFPPVAFDTGLGVPTSAAQILYLNIALAILGNTVGVSASYTQRLVLFSRGKPKEVPPVPPHSNPMMSVDVATKWGTQRKRGSYGRANVSPI